MAAITAQPQRDGQRDGDHGQCGRVGCWQLRDHMRQHRARAVVGGGGNPQKIGQGMHGNQQRRSGSETEQHRRRNEIGQHAQPQRANQPLQHADHYGDGQRQLDVGGAEGHGQRRQHGKQRQRIGVGRPRHDMPAGAEQRGDDARHHCRVQAIFRRQTRQRGKGDALGQHQHRAQQAGHGVSAQRGRCDAAHPVAEQPLHQSAGEAARRGSAGTFRGDVHGLEHTADCASDARVSSA